MLDRGRDSTDLAALGPYENDRRPIFHCMARASSVSKLFIIWHSVSDRKMHFRWHALKNVRLLHPSLKFRKNVNFF